MSIRAQFIWSFLSTLGPRVVQPIVYLLLARILSPEDFGIIAMAMVVVFFAQIFKDAGLAQVIIQAKDTSVADFAFTLQCIIGILVFAALYLGAPALAAFYRTPEVAGAIRVVALVFLAMPFVDIPIAMSMREMNFKVVFYRNLSVPLFEGITSVTLALIGYGYWALLWGRVAGQICTALVFLFLLQWKPRLDFNVGRHRSSLHFGFHVFLQGGLQWLSGATDKLLLGRYQTSASTGYYEVSQRVAEMPHALLVSPFNRVMYPLFAQRFREGEALGGLYLSFMRKILLLATPCLVYILITKHALILLFLGEKWTTVEAIFGFHIGVIFCAAIVTINQELFKAIGKAHIFTRLQFCRTIIALPTYYHMSQLGLMPLAIGRLLVAAVFSPISLFLAQRELRVSPVEFLAAWRSPLLLGLVIYGVGWAGAHMGLPAVGELVLNTSVLVVGLGLAVVFVEPDLLRIRKTIRSSMSNPTADSTQT